MKLRRRSWLFVTLGLVVAFAGGYGTWAVTRHARIEKAIPPPPDVSSWPAAFQDDLISAEQRARGYWRPLQGIARLARLYKVNGFYDEAIACCRGLIAVEPKNAAWPYQLADILAGFGRIDEALPWQRRAVELAPANAACRLRLGDMLLKRNDPSAAQASYAATLKLEPANAYAMLGLARCALARDDWSAARTQLVAAVAKHRDFTGGWDLLATVHDHLGEPDTARDARKNARLGGRFRESPEPWPVDLLDYSYDAYQLSVAAATQSDKAEAERTLNRAIQLAPNNSGYHRQLAKLLLASRNFALAREHLETAVRLVPTDAEAWAELINLLMTSNDGAAAQKALAAALVQCPRSAYLHFMNGTRLADLNRLDEAIREYTIAKQLQPNEARSYVQLSVIYARQDRLADALSEITAAHAVEPANASVVVLLIRLGLAMNDEPAARRWIKELQGMTQADPREIAAVIELYRDQFQREFR